MLRIRRRGRRRRRRRRRRMVNYISPNRLIVQLRRSRAIETAGSFTSRLCST